jgi:hypothetical protein
MRRIVVLLAATVVFGVFPVAANASTFTSVSANTVGDALEIDFVETGLQPGQNYAYTGSAVSVAETFQCYRSDTFTPLPRTFTVTSTTTLPDVRSYTADASGTVDGFIFLAPVLPPYKGCPGRKQEAVPIFVSYTNPELVNIVTFDVVDLTGTFSGPIEPD